jgi:hypothetical protein
VIVWWMIACVRVPPVPAEAPSGEGWVAYNQSYNFASASSSTSTYSVGNTQYTVTKTSQSSENTLNVGSPTTSREAPRCEGFGWLADCPAFGAPR